MLLEIEFHPFQIILGVWHCLKCSDSFTIYAKTSISMSFSIFLKNSVSWCEVDSGNVRSFLFKSVGRNVGRILSVLGEWVRF